MNATFSLGFGDSAPNSYSVHCHRKSLFFRDWKSRTMGTEMKHPNVIILSIIAIGIAILAFVQISGFLNAAAPTAKVETSYEEIVVILLTTVTVLFTVAALVIGILAFMGPRAIRREATKYAEKAVLKSIEEAMKPGGKATTLLENGFPPNEGPVKDWMELRVERQVISVLPLILDRVAVKSSVGPVDPKASEDEGQVD